MRKSSSVEPINTARIRKIEGGFSWLDHRFIPMMEGIEKNLIAYRNGVSQVLQISDWEEISRMEEVNHVIERGIRATDQVSEGCRKTVVPADGEKNRDMSKRIIKDILRQLEGAQDATGISARRTS